MNTPAQTPATAPAPTESTALPSLEARVAALTESTSEPAGETANTPPAPADPPSPADSAAAQRSEERRARLAEWQQKERARVDAKRRKVEQDKLADELAAAQKRAAELEAQASTRIERELLKDPARLIRMMGEEGVAPDKVAEAIREAITSPELAAERAARGAIDPKIAALEARLAEQQARIDAYEERLQADKARAVEQEQTQAFLGFVSQSAERAPLAAKLLSVDPEEFMQMAEVAAAGVPGLGPEALLDAVEELLDGETRKVAQKLATLYGLPSQAPAPTPPTRAAAQANTVSNSLAQGRTAIVEEEDFAKLPIEERAARLLRSM